MASAHCEAKHDEKVSILILSYIMFSDRIIVVRIVHRPGTRGVTVYTFVLLLTFTSSIDDSARWRIDYSRY